ncbi:hypothetical protein C4D60_Mb10t24890 [Musa balbisiana]|uniref:Uncharacterized protein n=1 Tax=Musa balbisiana TaxID=52838 RepID=A0A4S8IZN8_MUSBA|nr:hypothetical protein C4D60_Mb10t24890 [Musa balbisiana]
MACRRRRKERSIHAIRCAMVRGAPCAALPPPPPFPALRWILGDLRGDAGGDGVPPPPPPPPPPPLPRRL